MNEKWQKTWIQSHTRAGFGVRSRKGRTIRFSVPCQLNGSKLRIVFSNVFSETEDIIPSMTMIRNGEFIPITVNKDEKIVIRNGEYVASDPIKGPFSKGEILEFRLFSPGNTSEGNQIVRNAVWSKKGDYTSSKDFPVAFNEKRKGEGIVRFIPSLESIEIFSDDDPYVIAAIGDSIVQQSQWTNPLYERIGKESDKDVVLLNAGIGGNRICNDGEGFYKMFGPSGLNRLERDILSLQKTDAVIYALGTNDIGMGKQGKRDYVDCERMISDTKKIIEKLHEKGIRVIGTTILPRKGSSGYKENYDIENRKQYNDWVLNGNCFDEVLDFASYLYDEKDPEKMPDDCCLFDKVHPNSKGGRIIAEKIDLSILGLH